MRLSAPTVVTWWRGWARSNQASGFAGGDGEEMADHPMELAPCPTATFGPPGLLEEREGEPRREHAVGHLGREIPLVERHGRWGRARAGVAPRGSLSGEVVASAGGERFATDDEGDRGPALEHAHRGLVDQPLRRRAGEDRLDPVRAGDPEPPGQSVGGAVVGPALTVHETEVVDCTDDVVVRRRIAGGGPRQSIPHVQRFGGGGAVRMPGTAGGADQARRARVDGHRAFSRASGDDDGGTLMAPNISITTYE
jgi:hypothetical protein